MHARNPRRRDGGRWLVALLGGCALVAGFFAVPELAHGVVQLVVHPGAARRAPGELPSSGLRSGGQLVGPVTSDWAVICGAVGSGCRTDAGIPAETFAQNDVVTGDLGGAVAPSSTNDEPGVVGKTDAAIPTTHESAPLVERRATMLLVEVANPWWPEGREPLGLERKSWSLASDIVDPWRGQSHQSFVSSELSVIVNPWR